MILGCLVGFGDGFVVGLARGDVVGLLPSSSDEDVEESPPKIDVGFLLILG